MPRIRLFVDQPLAAGRELALAQEQAHYLRQVMRAGEGDAVQLFNGMDGEWYAIIAMVSKKSLTLRVENLLRPQKNAPDGWLAFAPIKHGRIDFLVEKATELGVSALLPVFTQYTIATRVNTDRLHAHAMEASEQSGRLDVPELREPQRFETLLAEWPQERVLLYCDETGEGVSVKTLLPSLKPQPWSAIIGPEGGFSPRERELLRRQPFVRAISLGPRVMRADTAALAALANIQAWLGDWDENPAFESEFQPD